MRQLPALVVLPLMLLATAEGHHSPAAQFDLSKRISITGIVREYRFVNPHALVILDVTEDDGAIERWMAEGADPNALRRLGWTGGEISPGDDVTVVGNPARDGTKFINWQTITVSGGRELAGGNGSFVFPALQVRWRRYAAAARVPRPESTPVTQ